MRRFLVAVVVAVVISVVFAAAQAKRVTVATTAGDVAEGVLKALTDTEVVIEVAGQTIRIDLASVRYLSFVGKIEPAVGASPVRPLDAALQALKDIRAATEVGVLRDHYSAKLLEKLPVVREFASGDEGWFDVKLAMANAIRHYQEPLATLASWQNAGVAMREANAWVAHAIALSAQPGEEAHVESSEESPIQPQLSGRLGFGDRQMPDGLDRNAGFSDSFVFTLTQEATVAVEMSCRPCRARLVLATITGAKLDGDAGNPARIRRKLPRGGYRIWAGAERGQVGNYTLTISGL